MSDISVDRAQQRQQDRLRKICAQHIDDWPNHCIQYKWWKPLSILSAPKDQVKQALKLGYAEWRGVITWQVYQAFFAEFADLATYIPDEDFCLLEHFREARVTALGEETRIEHPLAIYRLPSILATAHTNELNREMIRMVRDMPCDPRTCRPIDPNDEELARVRRILLESTTEFATLIEEWRLFIFSIGRETSVDDEPKQSSTLSSK